MCCSIQNMFSHDFIQFPSGVARGVARASQFLKMFLKMGLVARKPVFGVSVEASFKPVSSATETS